MRRWIKIAIWTVLLAAGVVVCAVRWQAWFGMPDEPQWTGDTLNYRFATFADDSVQGFVLSDQGWRDSVTPEQLNILVLGDIHSRLGQSDYDSLATLVPYAEALAQVGDWIDRGYDYYYQLLVREFASSRLAPLPVINTPGNHEYTKGLQKSLAPNWTEWFPQPENGPASVPGRHYYVDFPNLRFVVLDTNPLERLVYLTRTLTWLQQAIYSADGRFIVVMMHHPVYSAAKGRIHPLVYSAFRHALGEVDLVISGHDHSYLRRGHFVVLNTSGKAKPQKHHLVSDRQAEQPVYGVLSVKASALDFRVYRLQDGHLIDSFHADHN